MSRYKELAAVHIFALVLCTPIFLAYVTGADKASSNGLDFVFIAASMVFLLVFVLEKPRAVFASAARFGIPRAAARLDFLSVALIMLALGVSDYGSPIALTCAIVCAVLAAFAFVLAIAKTLMSPEVA